jgi:hypothetical protein
MDTEDADIDPELREQRLPRSQRLDVQPYRPDGGLPPLGMILALLITLALAIAVGRILSWVLQWLYIVLLFPFLAGMAVGGFGVFAIQVAKVRNALFASLVGLFAGFLCMAAMHYTDYERFQNTMELKPKRKIVVGVRIKPGDENLGFLEYVDRKAEKGVVIRIFGWPWNLGYYGSYFYWGLETLLAAWAARAMMATSTRAPFCKICLRWKVEHKLARLNLAPETAEDTVKRGELVRLADRWSPGSTGPIYLTIWSCPSCREYSTVDVRLVDIRPNAQGIPQPRLLVFATYPGEALPILEDLFGHRRKVARGEGDEEAEEG